MKKLLLASTALVATAGFAAADVSLSGAAEMGIKREAGLDNAEFHTDIGVTFALSGESDGGIAFGASVGLEEAQDGIATDIEDDYTVFISAGGLTLTMGDTDGGFDARVAEVGGPAGSIADDHTSHAGYSGDGGFSAAVQDVPAIFLDVSNNNTLVLDDSAQFDPNEDVLLEAGIDSDDSAGFGLDGAIDGQVARVDYAVAGAVFSLSAEIADDDTSVDPVIGAGVSYDADLAGITLGFGLGYQAQEDTGEVWGASVSGGFDNGLSAVLKYVQQNTFGADFQLQGETGDSAEHWAIGVGYAFNQFAIGVNYGVVTIEGDEAQSGFGLAANYDLGGGLSAQFGYGASMYEQSDDEDSYSLGLAMSF